VSVNRFCSSGLQTIAMAANSTDRTAPIASLPAAWKAFRFPEAARRGRSIGSAQGGTRHLHGDDRHRLIVAERYKLSREYQDVIAGIAAAAVAAAQQAASLGMKSSR